MLGLAEAGFTRVVVLVGINASQTRLVLDHGRQELYPSLQVEILDLGADNNHSHASSVLQAQSLFDKPFLICPSDHMYESKLYERMADVDLFAVSSAVLVETDLSGMIGLPRNTVHVAFRPLDTDQSIHEIGCELDAYNAIDAGLVSVTPAIFERLKKQEHKPYYTLADALSGWAGSKKLVYVETRGKTWFSGTMAGLWDVTVHADASTTLVKTCNCWHVHSGNGPVVQLFAQQPHQSRPTVYPG